VEQAGQAGALQLQMLRASLAEVVGMADAGHRAARLAKVDAVLGRVAGSLAGVQPCGWCSGGGQAGAWAWALRVVGRSGGCPVAAWLAGVAGAAAWQRWGAAAAAPLWPATY
jgi:hypothetical protein